MLGVSKTFEGKKYLHSKVEQNRESLQFQLIASRLLYGPRIAFLFEWIPRQAKLVPESQQQRKSLCPHSAYT